MTVLFYSSLGFGQPIAMGGDQFYLLTPGTKHPYSQADNTTAASAPLKKKKTVPAPQLSYEFQNPGKIYFTDPLVVLEIAIKC